MQIQPRDPAPRRARGIASASAALATLFGVLLVASAPTLAAPPVIEPGSPNGPTRFAEPDEISGGECLPNAGVLVAAAGLGEPQVGCLVPAAVGGGAPDRLQASTVTLLPVGPTLFRGSTFQSYDFQVSPSPIGRETAVPAMLTIQVDVKGLLAAVLGGRAGVKVSLEVLDVTGGGDDHRLMAAATIFEQEAGGGIESGLGIEASVSLPEPEGGIGGGVEVGMSGEVVLVNQKVSKTVSALLQRGHTYRVQVTLESKSGVGIGGGLALSGFFSPAGNELFSSVPDIRWLTLLLDGLAPSVAPPSGPLGIVPDFLSVAESFKIPAFEIPGFEIDSQNATLPIPAVSAGGQSGSGGGGSSSSSGLSLNVRSVSATLIGFDVNAEDAKLTTPGFTFNGFEFPVQTLLPKGPITSLEELVDRVRLPAFDEGFGATVLLDWMQPVLAEPLVVSATASPLVDAILNGAGVRVESLTLTMEEDVSQISTELTESVGDSQAALVASIDNARSSLLDRLDEVRNDLQAAIQDSSDALSVRVRDRSARLDGQLGDWITLNLRTKIEDNLAASGKSPIASFILPAKAPFYGFLEEAQEIVAETIERMSQAGQDVFNAQSELADGDAEYAAQKYVKAYAHYRKAYSSAVK